MARASFPVESSRKKEHEEGYLSGYLTLNSHFKGILGEKISFPFNNSSDNKGFPNKLVLSILMKAVHLAHSISDQCYHTLPQSFTTQVRRTLLSLQTSPGIYKYPVVKFFHRLEQKIGGYNDCFYFPVCHQFIVCPAPFVCRGQGNNLLLE